MFFLRFLIYLYIFVQRGEQHKHDGGLAGCDNDGPAERDCEPGVSAALAHVATEHRLDAAAASRQRPSRIQTLRLQKKSQPRSQQPKHDSRQRNHVSTSEFLTSGSGPITGHACLALSRQL